MKCKWIVSAVLLAASALVPPSAMAGGKEPKKEDKCEKDKDKDKKKSCTHIKVDELVFVDKGKKLAVFGELDCLEDKDVQITLEAVGEAVASCINPGGKKPPGQNPVTFKVELEGDTYIDKKDIFKYSADFKVFTEAPYLKGAPHCPSHKWTEEIEDVRFKKAILTIEQGGDEKVIKCTFGYGSKDGKINDVHCE